MVALEVIELLVILWLRRTGRLEQIRARLQDEGPFFVWRK